MDCSFGDISTTSFFPAKPLGCYGDGGAIFTDNDDWAVLDNVRVGMNSRLDTIQAGILQVKLKAFKEYEVDKVNEVAEEYTRQLDGIVKTPVVPDGYRSSWAQYTIILDSRDQRDGLQAYLKEQGIPSMIYYPTPMHGQTVYKPLGYASDACPVSQKHCATVLSLPMHPYITKEDITTVCNAVKSFIL